MEQVTRQITRHPFKIGQRIADRYVVRSFLGCGSMGWVLKVADDELNGEPVALKVLYPHLSSDANSIARFHAEVVTARRLSHPSIIHVHDLSEGIDSGMFIAMEFIDGMSLAELLAKTGGRGLPFDEGLLILTRIAEGLLYAHEHGVVHRDLKPANILVGREGTVKIGDFGLAKSFQQEFGLTRTGETLGTPLYMAPEQFESGTIDQRTDIYALGILAFELFTGHPPFKDAGFFELARQHIEEPLPELSNELGPLPPWCVELITRCTAKLPADRPLSIAEFLPQLQESIPAFTKLRNVTKPRRRAFGFKRPTNLRSLVVPAFMTALVFYHASVSFESYRSICAGLVFSIEYDFDFEMRWARAIWGYKGSLRRPESAFELVNPKDAVHLKTLFTAYSKAASSGKRLPNLVHQRDAQGSTLLHRAVVHDSRELIEAFDETGVGFSALDAAQETPVTLAVKGHHLNALRAMTVNRRFEGEGVDGSGDRPLHIAVQNRDEVAVQILLLNGVNPDARDRNGLTATHLAVMNGSDAILATLLSVGHPDLSLVDREGFTALARLLHSTAPDERVLVLAPQLIEATKLPEDLNVRDHFGQTALFHAVQRGNIELVQLLLANGARVDIRDDSGRTAAELAERGGHRALVKLLGRDAHDASH